MKNPEVMRMTMPRQGVSTRMYRENSLMLHGKGDIFEVLRFALQIVMQGK